MSVRDGVTWPTNAEKATGVADEVEGDRVGQQKGGRRRKKAARQAWAAEGRCAGEQTDVGTRKRVREIEKWKSKR